MQKNTGKHCPVLLAACLKWLSGILLCTMLFSCATQQEYIPAAPDTARIRVFHGTSVELYIGSRCSDEPGSTIHAASGGFSYLVPNQRIGMPSTADMPLSFHEYAVPAGQVVTVSMYWSADTKKGSGVRSRCGPKTVSFIPQSGHDYDTFMLFEDDTCKVRIRALTDINASGMATPVLLPPQAIPVDDECLRKERR